MANAQKLTKKSDWDRLNELIDWYEKNNPKAGQVIQVTFAADYLSKQLDMDEPKDGLWPYRGRHLKRPAHTSLTSPEAK